MVKTLRKAAPLNQNGGMDHPSVWLTLSPAIFGLVGVIIGGLITSGTSYWLETRKDKREQEKESRIRAATLRQAARLIDEEFTTALHAIQFSVEDKRWDSDVSRLETMIVTWEEHKKLLAMELSTSEWKAAFVAHIGVKGLIDLHVKNPSETAELSNFELKQIKFLTEQIEKGRAALLPFMTSEPSEVTRKIKSLP